MFRLAIALVFAGLVQSCATPKDLYRVASTRWVGDSVEIRIVNKQDPPQAVGGLETEFECLNCNLYLEPWTRTLDASGKTEFLLPEARQLVTTRISVRAYGIDTPAVLYQREPEAAASYYHLSSPLVGRVMLTSLSLLYFDSTFDSVALALDLQDEINIFADQPDYYLVHHPYFEQPLYLRKLGVVRVR